MSKMVVFPLGKLFYLGIKQTTRPICNQLKLAAKQSKFFRKYICIPPAQGNSLDTGTNAHAAKLQLNNVHDFLLRPPQARNVCQVQADGRKRICRIQATK